MSAQLIGKHCRVTGDCYKRDKRTKFIGEVCVPYSSDIGFVGMYGTGTRYLAVFDNPGVQQVNKDNGNHFFAEKDLEVVDDG